jgi:hypothetical protein
MNWKKLLKITAISLSSIIVVFGLLGFWLLTKLPGPSKVKEVIEASSKHEQKSESAIADKPSADIGTQYAAEDQEASEEAPAANAESKTRVATKAETHAILSELSKPDVPMVSACRDLARAGESGFFPKQTERSAMKFLESIVQPQKDPVLESIAPVFRYVFRAPGVREMLEMSEKAQGNDSLMLKAEFYREMYRAANFLRNNTDEMNQVVQKAYNLHIVSKAVALKPQLANDNATMSFCEQIEKSLTENQNLNVEEQVQEMQKFLQDSGIDAKSIGFDPKYRARVQSEFKEKSLTVTDSWLKDLISKGLL